MKSRFLFLCFYLACVFSASAQNAWWVFFTDKHGVTFDPQVYFAPEAIERRAKNHLPLSDSSDFPVNENYLREIAGRVDTLGYASRWFNAAAVLASAEQVEAIRKLPFVRKVVPQASCTWQPARYTSMPDTIVEDMDGRERLLSLQIDPMQGKVFAQHGYKGKGIIIAVLDAGFTGSENHPAFDQLRFNNQIRATYDFVNKRENVYSGAIHGTMVFSCIGGITDNTPMGLAPEATYLLARMAIEYGNQYRAEEYFVAAMEWSDKNGAMIINCSGGPGLQAYFPEQMDGKTALISRAANMAAAKGMLVLAAAGNEGEGPTDVLLPPADADSVLSITAINDSGYVAEYSSRGPTPDFKRKPDLCAPGTAIVADAVNNEFSVAEGTSFSCPLLAGFAACLMQMYPDMTAASIADTMRRSASLYPYFDYSHGYGVPQAGYFFTKKDSAAPSFTVETGPDKILIRPGDNVHPDLLNGKYSLLYYALEDNKGRIYKYEVFDMRTRQPITIYMRDVRAGFRIHIFYEGYYEVRTL